MLEKFIISQQYLEINSIKYCYKKSSIDQNIFTSSTNIKQNFILTLKYFTHLKEFTNEKRKIFILPYC
jgi:hypothetical protein